MILHQTEPKSEKLCATFFLDAVDTHDGIHICFLFLAPLQDSLSYCRGGFSFFYVFYIFFFKIAKKSWFVSEDFVDFHQYLMIFVSEVKF